MRAVVISDDGHGIPQSEVEGLFGKVGGSWKRHGARSKARGRMLHGKEGKGRLKALALGSVAEWAVRYRDGTKLMGYKIEVLRDDLADVRVTEPTEAEPALATGVEVRITELDRAFRSLEPENATQALTEVFAVYLTDYPDTGVYVDGTKVDPSALILDRKNFPVLPISNGGTDHAVEVDVIEWRSTSERWFFLCGKEGFQFQRITPRCHTPGYQFSAYLRSSYIDKLQEQGQLDLADMNPALLEACDAAAEVIKAHFRSKDAEVAQSEIERWKAEEVYRYRSEPQTLVEKAERKVFDIVALNVSRHLRDFSEKSKRVILPVLTGRRS